MPSGFYEIHPCTPELSPFVRRYLYADATADMAVKLTPTGHIYLGHMFNPGQITIISDGVERTCLSRRHFVGQVRDTQNVVRYRGHIGHITAEFTPTGFYRLFKIPASRITNLYPELGEVDSSLDRALQFALAGCSTREARLAAIDQWLLSLIPEASPDDPYVSAAVTIIEKSHGKARVAEVSAELGICARHLNRVFSNIVGVPPKYYAQMRQMNRMLALLHDGNSTAISDLAHDCGYCDQTHFGKAMQRFFGASPRRFLCSYDPALSVFAAESRHVEQAAPGQAQTVQGS